MRPPAHLEHLHAALHAAGVRPPRLLEVAALPDLTLEDIQHFAAVAQRNGKRPGWIVARLLAGERAPEGGRR